MELSALRALAARPGLAALLAALGPGNARLVGGAVRDALLGLPVTDLDLATALNPYEVMRRCGAAGIRTVPTGIVHGTVTALALGEPVEVTTLRADLATDGRRATVAFTDDWREDAARRDFTVNALYFDADADRLDDWFGGQEDLAAGRVRFIGAPMQRIAEDHLRILRFFRFTARFGRAVDAEGLAACAERANDLMALSRERIADEWLKLLALPDPGPTVELMLANRILAPVMPEIANGAGEALARLIAAEREAGVPGHPLRRFAALLPPDPVLAERIAARLKVSNRARKRLAGALVPVGSEPPPALAYRVGVEEAQDRLLLDGDPAGARALVGFVPPVLGIGGGALIVRGLAPGPRVARTLKAIEERWIAEGFPGEARLEEIVAQEVSRASD